MNENIIILLMSIVSLLGPYAAITYDIVHDIGVPLDYHLQQASINYMMARYHTESSLRLLGGYL